MITTLAKAIRKQLITANQPKYDAALVKLRAEFDSKITKSVAYNMITDLVNNKFVTQINLTQESWIKSLGIKDWTNYDTGTGSYHSKRTVDYGDASYYKCTKQGRDDFEEDTFRTYCYIKWNKAYTAPTLDEIEQEIMLNSGWADAQAIIDAVVKSFS